MDFQNEAVRIPAWAATFIVSIILPLLSTLILGADWRVALAEAVTAATVIIGGAEMSRAKVWSAESVSQLAK